MRRTSFNIVLEQLRDPTVRSYPKRHLLRTGRELTASPFRLLDKYLVLLSRLENYRTPSCLHIDDHDNRKKRHTNDGTDRLRKVTSIHDAAPTIQKFEHPSAGYSKVTYLREWPSLAICMDNMHSDKPRPIIIHGTGITCRAAPPATTPQ